MSDRKYCTFRVGGLLVGVEIDLVQEVLGDVATTRVALADSSVSGLINLRGQIVTAVDARRRLGLSSRREGERATNVVIGVAHESVSLVVDTEGEVVDVADTDVDVLPENVSASIREFVTGVCKIEHGLLLLLDAPHLLAVGSDRHDQQPTSIGLP